jgi:hypothetical protein
VRASLACGRLGIRKSSSLHSYLPGTHSCFPCLKRQYHSVLPEKYKIGLYCRLGTNLGNGKPGKPGTKIWPKLFKWPNPQSANEQQQQSLPPTSSGWKLNNSTQQPTLTNNNHTLFGKHATDTSSYISSHSPLSKGIHSRGRNEIWRWPLAIVIILVIHHCQDLLLEACLLVGQSTILFFQSSTTIMDTSITTKSFRNLPIIMETKQ